MAFRNAILLLLLLQCTAVYCQVANPTEDEAGNCAKAGEPNANPPVPGHMILTCGGPPIISVEYATYGIAKGKCSDGDYGHGSSWTFEDVTRKGPDADHPNCGCLDVKAKIAELCVGKLSCTIDATQSNALFNKDPCYQTGKWLAVVVECPSDWGWTFIMLLCAGLGFYAAGGIAYNHKTKGGALALSSLPHKDYWRGLYGLVADGAAYAHSRAMGTAKGGYTTVTDATSTESSSKHQHTQHADNSSAGKDNKLPTGAIPQPFADSTNELSGSEDDSLVE